MFYKLLIVVFAAAAMAAGAGECRAQGADDKAFNLGKRPSDDEPKSFRENLEKLRIEKEQKDHDQMVERSQEVAKIGEELERTFESKGKLTAQEMPKLATVEKLSKLIRRELGGEDDDETTDLGDKPASDQSDMSLAGTIKTFRKCTSDMADEVKKTTRFSISAKAIQAVNTVLKLSQRLRTSN